jgi:hypothetical protein
MGAAQARELQTGHRRAELKRLDCNTEALMRSAKQEVDPS